MKDIIGKMGLTLDISKTVDAATIVKAQMNEMNEERWRQAQAVSNEKQKILRAIEETASNTAESKEQLQKIVAQQIKHIELMEKQLSTQEEQLQILKNIFSVNEDSVIVEKEIMKLIEEQIDEKHPLWDYVKDKGGDVAVAGILQYGPVIINALKLMLVSKGFNFFI